MAQQMSAQKKSLGYYYLTRPDESVHAVSKHPRLLTSQTEKENTTITHLATQNKSTRKHSPCLINSLQITSLQEIQGTPTVQTPPTVVRKHWALSVLNSQEIGHRERRDGSIIRDERRIPQNQQR